MRLARAHVRNYRSVKDSGPFEIEAIKTILVGPNEAGKTALLQALQQLKPPSDARKLDPLRDYPRALYNDIATKKKVPAKIPVATGWFDLSDDDLDLVPASLRSEGLQFVIERHLDGSLSFWLTSAPAAPVFQDLKPDLQRLRVHLNRANPDEDSAIAKRLVALTSSWTDVHYIVGERLDALSKWLDDASPYVDEDNERELTRRASIEAQLGAWAEYSKATQELYLAAPTFVLFSNIFRVRPVIHLAHMASRLKTKVVDDEFYDYGNSCLLKLLGFSAAALSALGNVDEPSQNDPEGFESYRSQLDSRNYQLNAASIKLSDEIRAVWNPAGNTNQASRLRLIADGQYLKVVVEDSEGVEVELDQRSEGFQWLVSFFVVFFAEAAEKHSNTILLLDEPGVSLHALKQRDFRETVSKLASRNQTIYTTHSPFLVGPNELDLVRVVEMPDRQIGTKVHTSVTSTDPAALLPLQEALGYDLAQSLFSQQRNLVCEGLTDYWYLEATSALLHSAGGKGLIENIALIPSSSASKVVYFATILTSHNLNVAALLDSDNAGDQAAHQEVLVHRLGAKRILRTADYTDPPIARAEIEDLLRPTLTQVAKTALGIDIAKEVAAKPTMPIVDILERKGGTKFSKYKLAKAFVRWTRDHEMKDLAEEEQANWLRLVTAINRVLK